MEFISKSKEQDISDRSDAYIEWAEREANKDTSGMSSTEIKREDGSSLLVLQPYHSTTNKKVRIDGHFWIEDKKGKTIYDGGFSGYSHHLPCLNDPDNYKPNVGDFCCFQPAPPHLEKQIVDETVAELSSQYSVDTLNLMEDIRTPEQRLFDTCKTIFTQSKDSPFNCRQNAFCYYIINQNKNNIRFGSACIVKPRQNNCSFFFGHLDNDCYEDWVVDVSNGESIKHDRDVTVSEVPAAMSELECRKNIQQKENERKRNLEAIKNEKKAVIADKLAEELIADEERLYTKKSKQLPKKSKKLKRK